MDVFVHPHAQAHGLTEDEIIFAWHNYVVSQVRKPPQEERIVRVGYSRTSDVPIQMIGIPKPFGILIIHAMAPAQKAILEELGINASKGGHDANR